MNVVLVAGCAAGGALVGAALDMLAVGAASAAAPATAGEGAPTAGEVAAATAGEAALEGAVPAAAPEPRPTIGIAPGLQRTAAAGVTGLACAAAAARLGAEPVLAAYCALFAGLVAMSVADLRAWIVPRRLLYPTLGAVAVALVAASAVEHRWQPVLHAAIGGAVAFAVLFAVWWLFPRGMGFGDVRLAGLIGVGLGWLGLVRVYVGFLVAFLAGAVLGLALMAARGTGRKTRLPFAPALSLGAAVAVLWGSTAGSWLPGHP